MNSEDILPRFVADRVETALGDTRVVVVQGARQVGKSTLAQRIAAGRDGLVVTLDDRESRDFARTDPAGFVAQAGDGLLVIDEIQREPDLILALKAAVDRDRRPGRFLVTGSANLLDLATTHESMAGRAETVELLSLSQGEQGGTGASFIDTALDDRVPRGYRGKESREGYVDRACRGGYPEAIARDSSRRRRDWYSTYVSRIVNRDAADVSGLQRLADLPKLLRLIAARSGSTMVWSSLAGDAGIPRRTLDPYVSLLETLYLVHVLPAWSVNLTSREVKQPKAVLLDTGLMASLLGYSPEKLGPTSGEVGGLLEAFVVGEVLRHRGWSQNRVELFHYRDSRGTEVDLVIEAPDGRVVGIEVKAAATVTAKDAKGLATLRDGIGERFVGGYILHTGDHSRAVGERIRALPMDALWSL